MTGNEYQQAISNTIMPFENNGVELICSILKMQSSLGQLSNHLVKVLSRHKSEITSDDRNQMMRTLGDLLSYLARTAEYCGITLDILMQNSIDWINYNTNKERIVNNDIFRNNK